MKPRAFTIESRTRLRVIKTPIFITPGTSLGLPPPANLENHRYTGVWDTGATQSTITSRVANALDLKPIGVIEVQTAQGKSECNVYLVDIYLPNSVIIVDVNVTEAKTGVGCDALIGMDIIGAGDFAITNVNNKTVVSYQYPSVRQINFVKELQTIDEEKPGRNDPCPCGSRKKYKYCHGRF